MAWRYKIETIGPIMDKAHRREISPDEFCKQMAKVVEEFGEANDIDTVEVVDAFNDFEAKSYEDEEAWNEIDSQCLGLLYDWADLERIWIEPGKEMF